MPSLLELKVAAYELLDEHAGARTALGEAHREQMAALNATQRAELLALVKTGVGLGLRQEQVPLALQLLLGSDMEALFDGA